MYGTETNFAARRFIGGLPPNSGARLLFCALAEPNASLPVGSPGLLAGRGIVSGTATASWRLGKPPLPFVRCPAGDSAQPAGALFLGASTGADVRLAKREPRGASFSRSWRSICGGYTAGGDRRGPKRERASGRAYSVPGSRFVSCGMKSGSSVIRNEQLRGAPWR